MAIRIRARGASEGGTGHVIGRVACVPIDGSLRSDCIRVVRAGEQLREESYEGYAAVLFEGQREVEVIVPCVQGYEDLSFLQDGAVAQVNLKNGFTRVLYRSGSPHNVLFATERCNNNCLMCSQPPREIDDSKMSDDLVRLIELIPDEPTHLGISGGEPTLLDDGLLRVIRELKDKLPDTAITMLSNGRRYADESYVHALANIEHGNFLTSVPLYASNAAMHDYIVQGKGAFDQTIQGLYNAARYGLPVELRVVLHKQTIPGLLDLAEYIYRNLPFITGIALMGLENMGYVKKNWNLLWIDPVDYAAELEEAVRHLYLRKINVSLYNLPLCVLPESLWAFAKQSISDFKNIYLEECGQCGVKNHCSGLFQSSERLHSRAIKAIHLLNKIET